VALGVVLLGEADRDIRVKRHKAKPAWLLRALRSAVLGGSFHVAPYSASGFPPSDSRMLLRQTEGVNL